MIREIEVKIRVNSFELIEGKLKELGCVFSEIIIQNDIIFYEKDINLNKRRVFRIRKSNDKYLLTLKISEIELDSIERELEIKDPIVMQEIIELLDFEEVMRINKSRRKCNYKNYRILDQL